MRGSIPARAEETAVGFSLEEVAADTVRQVKSYRLADWHLQLFIAHMAQADEKAHQEARRLLGARSDDTKV